MNARRLAAEALLFEADAARHERDPEDEQEVANDRADQRRLHHCELTSADQEHGHDHLGEVSQGRVEQSSAARSEPDRELLGGSADEACKRHDRQGRGGEDEDRLMDE